MVGLPSLEVYYSNITEENNKFDDYTDKFDEFSFKNIKDKPEENLSISDITPYHLQHEKVGPRIIEAYKKLGLEKSNTDGNIIHLMGYARSPNRHFESYLRMVVGLDEDDIQLTLKQYKSNFVIMNYHLGFTQLKIFQKLFTPWVVTKAPWNLNLMILAWKQNFFWRLFDQSLER